eukprot:scaffold90557_cov14-Prasinocladus_malaysianus.AAC.1
MISLTRSLNTSIHSGQDILTTKAAANKLLSSRAQSSFPARNERPKGVALSCTSNGLDSLRQGSCEVAIAILQSVQSGGLRASLSTCFNRGEVFQPCQARL